MVVPVEDHGDDGALVLAVQQGDAAAFDALFRRHYPAVRRACVRRMADPVEADEAAQAAFVRAFERIDQCTGPRRFGPWVHVIARSLCMDTFRARSRVEPFEQPLADGREDRPNEPEESLLRDERAAHVYEALAALPERQRSAVIARDWEELRPGEIADRLGVSVGAVDSLLLRARRRMARSYRRLAGEAGGGRSTRTLRAAAAATAFTVLAGPHAVVAASAAATDAVETTASKAAVGVVDAVVSVTQTLGATVAPPGADDPPAPPVTTVVRPTVDLPGPASRSSTGPDSSRIPRSVTSPTVPPAPPTEGAANIPGATATARPAAATAANGLDDSARAALDGAGPAGGATTTTTLERPVRPVAPVPSAAQPAIAAPPSPAAVPPTTVPPTAVPPPAVPPPAVPPPAVSPATGAGADPPPPAPAAVTVATTLADLPSPPPVTTPRAPVAPTDDTRP